MSNAGEYYNESYAPIHSDYLAAEARANLAIRATVESTPVLTQNNQVTSRPTRPATSRKNRRSRYDENNYALPDYDETSLRTTSSAFTARQMNTRSTNFFTWKTPTISMIVLVLLSVGGTVAYFSMTSKGDPNWCRLVDCSNHDARESCPLTCSEPEWCKFANCSLSESLHSCERSCRVNTKIPTEELTKEPDTTIKPNLGSGMYAAVKDGLGCGKGSLNEDLCKLAAMELGYTTAMSTGDWGHAPYGCFVGHPRDGWNYTYFNQNKQGKKGNKNYRSICRTDAKYIYEIVLGGGCPDGMVYANSCSKLKYGENSTRCPAETSYGPWTRCGHNAGGKYNPKFKSSYGRCIVNVRNDGALTYGTLCEKSNDCKAYQVPPTISGLYLYLPKGILTITAFNAVHPNVTRRNQGGYFKACEKYSGPDGLPNCDYTDHYGHPFMGLFMDTSPSCDETTKCGTFIGYGPVTVIGGRSVWFRIADMPEKFRDNTGSFGINICT